MRGGVIGRFGREDTLKRAGPTTTEPDAAGGVGPQKYTLGWTFGSNLQDPSRAGVRWWAGPLSVDSGSWACLWAVPLKNCGGGQGQRRSLARWGGAERPALESVRAGNRPARNPGGLLSDPL